MIFRLVIVEQKKVLLPEDLCRAYEVLSEVSAENVWLANFHSENTKATYKHAVSDFIYSTGIGSPEQLYKATQAHVIAWRDLLRSQGLKNATIRNRLAALSSLYTFLSDKQLSPHNPVSGVLRPNSRRSGIGIGKTPALTRKQVRLLLDAPFTYKGRRRISELQQLRDRAILHLYFYTGGRCSEPARLKVHDFRQDQGLWVVEFTTKGEKTNIVAIGEVGDENAECVQALQDYLDASGHQHNKTDPLFLAVKSGRNSRQPMTRGNFYSLFKKYIALTGLPDKITPHSARATFITQAYDMGISGEDIQRTVNHSSITTTESYNQSAKKLRKSAALGMHY